MQGLALGEKAGMLPESVCQTANRPFRTKRGWQQDALLALERGLPDSSQRDSPRRVLPPPWNEVALPLGKVMLEPPRQQALSKMARVGLAGSPRTETQAVLGRMKMADFPALPWLGRSIRAVCPQAAAPCVDPAEKSVSETAPDTHDKAQIPAAPPGRCAAHFQAAQPATPAAARRAKPRHESLRGANVRSRHQPSAACGWQRPHECSTETSPGWN